MRQLLERNRFLIAFATLSSIMGSSVGVAKVTTSLYAVQLGADASLLGMIASSQSIGVLVMSLPLGFMVDRHGPAKLFVIGTAVAGTLYLLLPLVPAAWFLLACTTAIGFFMPFRFVSLNTVFLEQLVQLGDTKAGWYRGTHMAGMFLLGPMIAASMIKELSFQGTYWCIAATFALTVLLCPIVFSQHHAHVPSEQRFAWAELGRRLTLLARDPELRRAGAIEFCAQAINGYYSFFIVVIGVTLLGLSDASAASLVVVQGCSYVFCLIALGGFTGRLGARRVSALSCSVLAVALLTLALTQQLWLVRGAALLLGLGLGLLQIVNVTRFARIGARIGRGKTAGVNALVGPAGGFVGSLLGGSVGKLIGLQKVFLLFLPVLLVLAWRSVRLPRPLALEHGALPPAE